MGTAQTGDTHRGILFEIVNQARGAWLEYFAQPREAERAARIVSKIRESEPKFYVNGKRLAGALVYGTTDTIQVRVLGRGYSLMLYPYIKQENAEGQPTSWSEAVRY